jgi:hypothetical protein
LVPNLMIIGGVVAIFFGVDAEGKALEDVAKPLSVIGKPAATIFRTGSDREGVDDIAPASAADPAGRGYGQGTTASQGYGTDGIPDQRYAEHDDPARTRPDDDPLA